MLSRVSRERRQDLLARMREANLRYLSDWAWMAFNHARLLVSLVKEAIDDTAPAPSTGSAPQPPAPSVVIEAEAGAQGRGVFLVENTLARPVRGKIEISPFVDADGHVVHPSIVLEPAEVVLDAGEEVLVYVNLNMDETIPAGVRYAGRFTVPGLAQTPVEAIIKRSPSTVRTAPPPVVPAGPTFAARGAAQRKPRRKRATPK